MSQNVSFHVAFVVHYFGTDGTAPSFVGQFYGTNLEQQEKNISVSQIIYKKVQLFGQMGRTSSAVSYFWANYTKKIWIKSFKMSATLKCRAELFASLKFF